MQQSIQCIQAFCKQPEAICLLFFFRAQLYLAHTACSPGPDAHQSTTSNFFNKCFKVGDDFLIAQKFHRAPKAHILLKHLAIVQNAILYNTRVAINASVRLQTRMCFGSKHIVWLCTLTSVIASEVIHHLTAETLLMLAQRLQWLNTCLSACFAIAYLEYSPVQQAIPHTMGLVFIIFRITKSIVSFTALGRLWHRIDWQITILYGLLLTILFIFILKNSRIEAGIEHLIAQK